MSECRLLQIKHDLAIQGLKKYYLNAPLHVHAPAPDFFQNRGLQYIVIGKRQINDNILRSL